MAPNGSDTNRLPDPTGAFATTHWNVVLNAGGEDSSQALVAIEKLARAYWYPLYAYVRRKGHDTHTAEDLTQEFFARVISRNFFARVDRTKGRFRSWLLGDEPFPGTRMGKGPRTKTWGRRDADPLG